MSLLVLSHLHVVFSLLLGTTAAAQSSPPIPSIIRERIEQMDADCRGAGGRPVASDRLARSVDLLGDGVMDWVFEEARYQCDGAASLFVGAGGGGSSIGIYTDLGNDWAAWNFDGAGFGYRVRVERDVPLVYLGVGGELCGQKITDTMSRVEYERCWRPVVWDVMEQDAAFVLGPVGDIKSEREMQTEDIRHVVGTWSLKGRQCTAMESMTFMQDGGFAGPGLAGRWREAEGALHLTIENQGSETRTDELWINSADPFEADITWARDNAASEPLELALARCEQG